MEKKKSLGSRISNSFLITLFRKRPLSAVGFVILCFFVFLAIFADVVAPYPMVNGVMQTNLAERLEAPSLAHPLGTDSLGTDVLSYLIYGARTSVILAFCCTILSTIISVIIGVTSAVIGGVFDLVIQRIVDAFQCIPGMLIMLIMMSMLGNGLFQLILVIAIPSGIGGSRMIRATAFSVKDSEYVKEARMLGGGSVWKMIHHVVPNIMPIVIMNLANSLGGVVMQEASLNFLGYGVDVGTPSWGYMLTSQGRSSMYVAPWLALSPGICITLMVFAAAILGDGVRDMLDPRLKGGVGGYNLSNKQLDKIKRKLKVKEKLSEDDFGMEVKEVKKADVKQ